VAKRMWKLRKGVWAGITPSGKRVVGSKSEVSRAVKGSRKTKSKSRSGNKTRRGISLPRRKRRSYGFGVRSLMKFARLGALAAPAIGVALKKDLSGENKVALALRYYTGYDINDPNRGVQLAELKKGWLPYILTSIITYGISKINGIIRRL